MKTFSALLLLTLALVACKQPHRQLTHIGQLKFQTFNPDVPSSGQFVVAGRTYYFFPYLETHSAVIVCDENGKFVKSITLKETYKKVNEINRIFMQGLDSVIVTLPYINRAFIINDSGDVVADRTFRNFGKPLDSFELFSTHFGIHQLGNRWIFGANVVDFDYDPKEPRSQYLHRLSKTTKAAPYFISFSQPFLSSNSDTPTYELRGFFNRFVCKDCSVHDTRSFSVVGDSIIFFSRYSDSLYIAAHNPLDIVKAIRITSSFTPLDLKAPLTDSSSSDQEAHAVYTHGHLLRVMFDEQNDVYYVSVMHRHETDDQQLRKWSVIVLDRNFNLIDEKAFSENDHRSASMLLHSKGLLIERNLTKRQSKNPIYDLYALKAI